MVVSTTAMPGEVVTFEVRYRSRGLGTWTYAFAPNGTAQIRNFHLTLNTNFADIDFPPGVGGIAPHQVLGLRPDLDTDMDREEGCAVRFAERPSWQIRPDHHDSHDGQSGSILRGVCAFVVG